MSAKGITYSHNSPPSCAWRIRNLFMESTSWAFTGKSTIPTRHTRRTRRQSYTARPCRAQSASGTSGSSGVSGVCLYPPGMWPFLASGSQDICPGIFLEFHIGATLNHWIRNTVIQWATELFQSGLSLLDFYLSHYCPHAQAPLLTWQP
jgi:hypothetical protein